MATITVTVRLRRTEGRSPVDVDHLAAALLDELESSIIDTEFSVEDSAGEYATYEVTAVTATKHDEPAVAHADPDNSCAWCGTSIVSDPLGRPRLYCSPACRQAAHRARRRDPAAAPAADETDGSSQFRPLAGDVGDDGRKTSGDVDDLSPAVPVEPSTETR
jgi:hypothetical protein